jgi:HTH-type transcriptional regulator/antitoxin HipB
MKDTPLRNPEQLGRSVRLKRKEHGLSQLAFAAQLGVERKWVIHLEAGNPRAELGLVLKALHALGLHALLHDEGSSPAKETAPAASRLDEVFRQLQRPQRK